MACRSRRAPPAPCGRRTREGDSRGSGTLRSPARTLLRPHQRVLLPAGAELDVALWGKIGQRQDRGVVGERLTIDASAAALDQAPGVALAGGEAGAVEKLDGREAARQIAPGDRDARQLIAG